MSKYYFLLFVLPLLFASCSFKSSEEGGPSLQQSTSGFQIDPNGDSDGDKVIDKEEVSLGRNPFIADIPELKVNFLQNYKIEGSAKKTGSETSEAFVIDTKVNSDNPDFQYRVGKLFIRDLASKLSATVGKFSGHSSGNITPNDLSWIKYPDIDPIFYSSEVLGKKKYFGTDYNLESITVTVENSIRLKQYASFKEIKNLELNFYYYNYEKESYELLATQVVDRHFQAGVNEVFEVKLENIPRKLLEENFLKRGEFIISEIKDFDVPELGIKYSELLSSVKSKCIPVSFNTPLEATVSYVTAIGDGVGLQTILTTLFDKNFEVREDELERIGQFTNNLPTFMYLKEVQDKDKLGKWFVLTNPIREHFLDHKFTPSDFLAISYLTGKELASQSDEKTNAYLSEATGGKDSMIYPLGIVGSNSKLDVQISPVRTWGIKVKTYTEHFSQHNPMDMDCDFSIWIPQSYDTGLVLSKDLGGELEKMELMINQEVYSLKDLVSKKLVDVRWMKENLHLTIHDVTKIQDLSPTEDNVLALKLTTFNGHSSVGVRLDSMSGGTSGACPSVMCAYAGNQGPAQISTDSLRFGEWRQYVRNLAFTPAIDYKQEFSINVSSIVNNYHN